MAFLDVYYYGNKTWYIPSKEGCNSVVVRKQKFNVYIHQDIKDVAVLCLAGFGYTVHKKSWT